MTLEAPTCNCITCGDQGIEMTVVSLDASGSLAWCVEAGGDGCEIDVSLVQDVHVGTRIVAHAGVAIALAAAADPSSAPDVASAPTSTASAPTTAPTQEVHA